MLVIDTYKFQRGKFKRVDFYFYVSGVGDQIVAYRFARTSLYNEDMKETHWIVKCYDRYYRLYLREFLSKKFFRLIKQFRMYSKYYTIYMHWCRSVMAFHTHELR